MSNFNKHNTKIYACRDFLNDNNARNYSMIINDNSDSNSKIYYNMTSLRRQTPFSCNIIHIFGLLKDMALFAWFVYIFFSKNIAAF